jgi:hypothetical protein
MVVILGWKSFAINRAMNILPTPGKMCKQSLSAPQNTYR